ncbi:hypothetical protein TNCV_3166711 [Trichonephila clavipes]|uniref:Uncharacterized protein n=1 Tax=Trichonephila clavipes TaxID=2585209 RepID=A0A8X6RI15_TRICX|nr:hypothetical protein TNCV_3166711 [Trichonephila clavipes]
MDPACQQGTVQADGGSIMVWDVCNWHDMEPLTCVDTTLSGDRVIWAVPKFDKVILSTPTPGPSSHPARSLSSSSFHKYLPYSRLDLVTVADNSFEVNTEYLQSVTAYWRY